MKTILTDLLALASLAAVTYGLWLIYDPLAFIFCGVVGYLLSRDLVRGSTELAP